VKRFVSRATALPSYVRGRSGYLIRYKSADDRAVESWWRESAIEQFAVAPTEVATTTFFSGCIGFVVGSIASTGDHAYRDDPHFQQFEHEGDTRYPRDGD
jgi:hypothetical protein